jgi:hypothetical protein
MIELVLLRVGSSEQGTFGVLRHGQVPFALTLEDPWNDNQVRLSCIPAGHYVCQGVLSPKFGMTYEVKDVPGRSHILFHAGNTIEDTQGCILVGEEFAGTWMEPILAHSKRGFAELLSYLDGLSRFGLTIKDSPPVPLVPVTA